MSGEAVADVIALGVLAWALWTVAALAVGVALLVRRMTGRAGR